MASANHYDVIIIGNGAGGGTLAYHLVPSGKDRSRTGLPDAL